MTVNGLQLTPRPFTVEPVPVAPSRDRRRSALARLTAGGRARTIFRLAATGYAAAIPVVVLMAGIYVFVSPALLALHTNSIHVFAVLSPAMVLAAFVGRLDGQAKRDALALGGLLVLQGLLAHVHAVAPWVSALHPVNAMVMFWYGVTVARRAWAA